MLYAVAGEHAVLVRVEPDGDRDHHCALGETQPLGNRSADAGVRERQLELRQGLAKQRRVPLERRFDLDDLGHAPESS